MFIDGDGDISTQLIKPCTNFLSRKLKLKEIIFTKRVSIVKPVKLIEMAEIYFNHEAHRYESTNIYICDNKVTVIFENSKISLDINTFNSSNPYFNMLSKKHIEKIYFQKNILNMKYIAAGDGGVNDDFIIKHKKSNVINFS